MKKKTSLFLILVLTIFCSSIVKAQYGREWIVPGQSYWKIPVSQSGMYAIPFATLSSVGISTIDPSKIQIWHRGVEQTIAVNTNTVFFLGQKNDGTLDSLIYEQMSNQPNKYYSLFSDTTYYFVTLGSSNGKRLLSNGATAGVIQASHTKEITQVYTDQYFDGLGTPIDAETHLSAGDIAEGWTGSEVAQSGATPVISPSYAVPIENLSNASATASLEILITGRNSNTHRLQVLIGNNPNAPDATYTLPDFYGRTIYKFTQPIPASLLTNNQPLNIYIKVIGSVTLPDRISVSHIVLKYPQNLDLTSQSFTTLFPTKDNQGKTLSMSGFTNGSFLWDITTDGAFVGLSYTYGGGTATTDIDMNVSKVLYANSFLSISSIENVDVTPFSYGSKMLLVTHNVVLNGANDYANYRRSFAGGNMTVLVAEVHKLYNLYSYGEKHPIAIQRFCKEQLDQSTPPKYLFLIGKNINLNYYGQTDVGGQYYRKNPEAFINNNYINTVDINYRMEDLVPAYGFPASDTHFSMTDNTYRSKLATGRLSARTNAEVLQYLDKVIATEALDSTMLWRKHVVHLSGGHDNAQIAAFKNVVNGFKTIVENSIFGGKVVQTLSKKISNGAVDPNMIFSVAEELNKGLSYITFFGHSAPNVIDLDIGRVSNPSYGYDNKGKYPLLFMNGCQSADFSIESCIAENWIMTPQKGAVLALGHASIGFLTTLEQYTSLFYKINFNDSKFINASIGDVQKKTLDSFITLHPSLDIITKTQVTQFNLQGDPSLAIYKPSKTDYAISGDREVGEKKVFLKSYDGKQITAKSAAFGIAIPVINYGIASPKDVQFKVKHYVSGALYKEYAIYSVSPIGYVDTAIFNVPANSEKLFGLNRFEITIDPNDSIAEFNEGNNFATIEYFVPLSSVTCLLPYEYSVVYNQPVTFIAQSNDLLQSAREYYIEIDTSHLYNSPAKIVKIIKAGALVKFTQSLLTNALPSDSLVYYWRVRFNDLPAGEAPIWGESSFIYIRNSSPGWSQSEYPQFFKDTYSQMEISSTGELSFSENVSRIYAYTQGNSIGTSSRNVGIGVNNNALLAFRGPTPCAYADGCYVIVFDGVTALPYFQTPNYGVCGPYLSANAQYFYGLENIGAQNNLKNFLLSVKPNDFVLLVSSGSMHADVWDLSLKDVLINNFGAQHINAMGEKTPYIILAKKGAATPVSEVYSLDATATIELNADLKGIFKEGRITSTLIGPAEYWGTYYKTIVESGNDSTNVSVIRYNPAGLAVDTIAISQVGDVDLGPIIDAKVYPYIKLLYYASDTIALTPPYLKKWQVIYGPAPEGTLAPEKVGIAQYTVSKKMNGETFVLSFAFENISEIDFPEPLKVVFTLRSDNGKISRDTLLIGLLPKGQVTNFNYTVKTQDFFGIATLQCYVNPRFQNEQYYNNNILDISFEVLNDKTHPVVDVMFDGVHIFDGDIISPSPVISVTLNDNNPYLKFSDPNTLQVYLLRPGRTVPEEIDITNPDVIKWGEDPQRKGKYIVEYNPKKLPDGIYKLIVQGKDASGNKSGTQTFEVKFEVVNASSITNFYPYPNPFSSSTRFVFTLTGNEIPEDIKIQIMTVSGKVVREIMKHELGNIHIGNNITDYHWDGTDEFGDKLANGVYIYRVVIKNKGDNFDHRDTAGDKAFKKGYGKLYILR